MRKKYITHGAFILIISFLLLGIVVVVTATPWDEINANDIVEETIAETEPFYLEEDIIYISQTTSTGCQDKILLCQDYINRLQSLDFTNEVIINEIERVEEIIEIYTNEAEELAKIEEENAKWILRAAEYPVATEVWLYMYNTLGWNPYVCAGIMGNMMAECGGHTLNLNPTIRNLSSGCYGICQWHPQFFPDLQGSNLEQQLSFLGVSVETTYNGWAGKMFNTSYEEFISLTDYNEVAKSFNNVYERPGYYSSQRSDNAKIAYEYFMN